METKIVLISMVRNESKILERCLKSCENVCDAYCFLDTGSTDTTVDIIQRFLESHTGRLYQDPFKNFGYSRSKSFNVCKEYLQELGWDLTHTYGLLLDADMILKPFPSFLTQKKENKFTHPGYRFIQSAGNLDYYNVRMVRMSDDWTCIGVTHEYWNVDKGSIESFEKDTIYIDDVNDGGCKSDKFERDVRLLEKGLEDEPENKIRYTFYLAQSYEHINKEKSIEYYKKRVEYGGWFEECYMAQMRIGDMLQNEAEKVCAYLDACNIDPKRAEAYYRLAKYYRIKGKNNLAAKFIMIGKCIKFPKDRSLFLEKDVYSYRFDEELSICGFYVDGIKDAGFSACEKILLQRSIPHVVRDLAFNNEYYYIKPLDKALVLDKQKWTIEKHPTFKESSCSLLYTNTSFIGIQRTVNYSIDKGQYIHDGPVRTINYLITGNGTRISSSKEIEVLIPKKRESRVQDLEDMRLFKYKNTLYAFGTTYEYGPHDHPSQVLCRFKDHTIVSIVPLTYKSDIVQKNWCPFVYKNKLVAIYSYEPFILLEINPENGECTEYMKLDQPMFMKDFRGSTSPVKKGDKYYQLVHSVYFKDTRKYIHRMITYNEDMKVLTISQPFYFENMSIEYSLGLGYDGTTFYVHYSSMDNSSTILKVPYI
jgi:hypothetical protein